MRKTILTFAFAAALGCGATPALAMGADCTTTAETITVLVKDAVPAVPEVAPVYATVTEYEFTHAQDGNGNSQGQGPANKWVTDPDWNAGSNPNSIGWTATGNTRQVTTDTVLVPGSPAVPAQEAVYETREIPVTTCKPVLEPTDPPLVPTPDPSDQPVWEPEAPAVPVPAGPAPEAPAPVLETSVVVPEPAAVAEPVAVAVPAAAEAAPAAAQPDQLANTGAASWVLPAGLGLLAAGTLSVVALRRRTI